MAKFSEQLKRTSSAIGRFFVSVWQTMLLPFFQRVRKFFTPQNLKEVGRRLHRGKVNPIALGMIVSFAVVFGISLATLIGTSGAGWSSVLFYNPADFFMDFFKSMSDSEYSGLYTEWGNIYAPIMYIPLNFLLHLIPGYEYMSVEELRNSQAGIVMFMILMILCHLAFVAILYRAQKGSRAKKVLFIFFIYVSVCMISVIERGNVILFALITTGLFLLLYRADSWWQREISYVCLALSVCIKIYPVFFGILLLRDKQFTGAIRCAVYWLVLFVAPFLYYGNMAEIIIASFRAVFDFVGVATSAVAVRGTVWLAAKEAAEELLEDALEGSSSFGYTGTFQILFLKLYQNYFTLTVSEQLSNALFIVAFIFTFFQDKTWKAALLLSILSITLSSSTYTYSLAFLIMPCIMFLNEASWKNPLHWIYAALFVCIFGFFVWEEQYYHVSPYYQYSFYYCNYANLIERFAILIMTFLLTCEGVFHAILRLEDGIVWCIRRKKRMDLRRKSLAENPYGRKR